MKQPACRRLRTWRSRHCPYRTSPLPYRLLNPLLPPPPPQVTQSQLTSLKPADLSPVVALLPLLRPHPALAAPWRAACLAASLPLLPQFSPRDLPELLLSLVALERGGGVHGGGVGAGVQGQAGSGAPGADVEAAVIPQRALGVGVWEAPGLGLLEEVLGVPGAMGGAAGTSFGTGGSSSSSSGGSSTRRGHSVFARGWRQLTAGPGPAVAAAAADKVEAAKERGKGRGKRGASRGAQEDEAARREAEAEQLAGRWLDAYLAQCAEKLPRFTAAGVARLLTAVAAAGVRPDDAWLDAACGRWGLGADGEGRAARGRVGSRRE